MSRLPEVFEFSFRRGLRALAAILLLTMGILLGIGRGHIVLPRERTSGRNSIGKNPPKGKPLYRLQTF